LAVIVAVRAMAIVVKAAVIVAIVWR
jgi:hypothetical protein